MLIIKELSFAETKCSAMDWINRLVQQGNFVLIIEITEGMPI